LTAPTNLTAGGIGNSQIRLDWADNSTSETGFEMQSRWVETNGTFVSLTPSAPANQPFYVAGSAPLGRTYEFRVRAVGSAGAVSEWSNLASSTSLFNGPPAGPDPIATRWSAAAASTWFASKPRIMGFNLVPSTAGNTTEMWQTPVPNANPSLKVVGFDPATIQSELQLAQTVGYNSVRIFLPYIVWKDNPALFKSRFEQVLVMAASRNISVVPVLFDDCVFPATDLVFPDNQAVRDYLRDNLGNITLAEARATYGGQVNPFLGRQRDPIPGMILSNWTPCPGRNIGTNPLKQGELRQYVQDMVGTYKNDARILMWDLFNEPNPSGGDGGMTGTIQFLRLVFSWAREAQPTQPLTTGPFKEFSELGFAREIYKISDIISFHRYALNIDVAATIDTLRALPENTGYPVICTEWFARSADADVGGGLTMFKQKNAGSFMWGFVNGRSQAQYPWYNLPYMGVPPQGWFHDIFYSDQTPYRAGDISAIMANKP